MMKQAILAAAVAIGLSDAAARAIVITGTGTAATPGRNTIEPTGPLAGSGWATQGIYNGYSATPVSATWFLTANHIGLAGTAGQQVVMPDGTTHSLTGVKQRVGSTDLILYQVSSAQPFGAGSIAPLYTSSDGALTTSDQMVMFGRGVQRGAEITGKGWAWGGYDVPASNTNLNSWGTNTYDSLRTVAAGEESGFGAAAGSRFIKAAFNSGVDANEGVVTLGDSGGGLFVLRSGVWKLVGIVNGVDAVYQTASNATPAAAYDARGLYQFNGATYTQIAGGTVLPVSSYFSYVPDSASAIAAIVPEPSLLGVAAVASAGLLRRRR